MAINYCLYEVDKEDNSTCSTPHGMVVTMPNWKYCPYCGGNIVIKKIIPNEIKKAE